MMSLQSALDTQILTEGWGGAEDAFTQTSCGVEKERVKVVRELHDLILAL